MTVHVYHSYRQPNGSNYCTPLNGMCTHLCLPAPQLNPSALDIDPSAKRTRCACPDGLVLVNDGLTCETPGEYVTEDPTVAESTIPTTAASGKYIPDNSNMRHWFSSD